MANPWDEGIPVGNTDPELLQAIEAAKKQAWLQKPTKPTKFNLGETRSPLEILQAEAAGENTTTSNWNKWETKGLDLRPAKYNPNEKPWDKGIPVSTNKKEGTKPWDEGIPVGQSILNTIGSESDKFSEWINKGIEAGKEDPLAAVGGFVAGNVQFPMQVVESAAELATWPKHRRSWTEMQENIAKTMQEQKEALLPKKAIEAIDSPAGQAGAALPFAPITYPLERIPEALKEQGYPETASAVGVLVPPILGAAGAHGMVKGMKGKAPKLEEPTIPKEEPVDYSKMKFPEGSWEEWVSQDKIPENKIEFPKDSWEEWVSQEKIPENRDLGNITKEEIDKLKTQYIPENKEHTTYRLSPTAVEHINNGDIRAALEDYSSKTASKLYKTVADRLLEFNWDGIRSSFNKNTEGMASKELAEGEFFSGIFNPHTREIILNPRAINLVPTLLHEAIHAVTQRAIQKPKTVKEKQLIQELERILSKYDSTFGKVGEEGTSFYKARGWIRTAEFAAEVFTRPKVIQSLKTIKDSFGGRIRTLYTSFVQAITKYLGIGTLGQKAFSVIDQIMTEAHKNSPRDPEGRPLVDFDLDINYTDRRVYGNTANKSRAESLFNRESYDPTRDRLTQARDKTRNQEKIIQLLRSEKTADGFLRKATTLDINYTPDQWKSIFANKEALLTKYGADPSSFSMRTTGEKVLATDTRDFTQFEKEELSGKTLWRDIKDLGTYLLAPRNIQALKNRLPTGPEGAKIVSWAIDKNYATTRQWDRIASDLLHGRWVKGFGLSNLRYFTKENAGVLKPLTDLGIREQAPIFRAWLDMERNNHDLVKAGLQWADDNMLINKYHLTPEQIAGYKAVTKLVDTLMDVTNSALVKKGEKPLKKIPGFFPRYLQGRYRIHLHIKPFDVDLPNGKTFKVGGLVDILQFKSERAAQAFIKETFGNDPALGDRNGFFIEPDQSTGKHIRGLEPDTHVLNFASEMSIAAEVSMSKGRLNPILKKRLNNIVSNATSAHLRQTFERTGALTTYRGSEGISHNYFKELADTTEVLNVFNQYAQSVFKYAKNVDLQTEVLLPVRNAIEGKLPNTLRYVDDMIGNSMDKHINKIEELDDFVDAVAGKWIGKGTIAKGIPILNKILIAKALAGSGAFMAVQTLQPYVAGTMFLPMMHAEMSRLGHKVPFGAAIKAMARATKELYFGFSPEGKQALSYAAKNHITDTAVWETLQKDLKLKGIVKQNLDEVWNKLQIRPILENIEKVGRGHTFMQGYFYAREAGFTRDAALGFADRYTSITMGDYSKAFRPLMMENMGMLGRLQTPFATLMNTYIGNMAQGTNNLSKSLATMPGINKIPYTKVIKDLPGLRDIDLTEPNRPQFKQAAIGALAFTAAVWAWSGFQGMPGMQEWQAVADKWNEKFPDNPMLGPTEIMFNNNVDDYNKYGLISKLTNMNIGASQNAPSLVGRVGVPSAPLVSEMGDIVWGALRAAFAEGKTEGAKFKTWSKVSPPPARALVEHAFTPEGSDMVPVPGESMQGFRTRTPFDWAARTFGSRSLEESDELSKFYITKQREARDNKAKSLLAKEVMTAWINKASADEIRKIVEKASSVGADPMDLLENAKAMYQGRYIGWKERAIMKSGEGLPQAHRLENLQNLYQK